MSSLQQEDNNMDVQPWYSLKTIQVITAEIEDYAKEGDFVAFVSTPALYFSVTGRQTKYNAFLFDVNFLYY